MKTLTLIIIGLAGVALGYWLAMRRVAGDSATIKPAGPTDDERKILELFVKKESIRNDDVEDSLGVSDATATRYLQKMEDKKLIVQIGEGSASHYERL